MFQGRRKFVLAFATGLLVLTGCRHHRQAVFVSPPTTNPKPTSTTTTTLYSPQDFEYFKRVRWNTAVAKFKKEQQSEHSSSSRQLSYSSSSSASSSQQGIDWDCVAIAETGGNFHMHGSAYSSAYGIMNEAVRENATPEVASRVLNGTASKDEQLAIAEAIARRFGFRQSWGWLTVQKCS